MEDFKLISDESSIYALFHNLARKKEIPVSVYYQNETNNRDVFY